MDVGSPSHRDLSTQQRLHLEEYQAVREELRGLKHCQITFLASAVTATGVVLGFAGRVGGGSFVCAGLLAPLVILLPSWWVVFDKATTITRAVAYLMHLERAILGLCDLDGYQGFENALADYRALPGRGGSDPDTGAGARSQGGDVVRKRRAREALKLVFYRTTHHYWVLVYHVFLWLSVLCIALCCSAAAKVTTVLAVLVGIAILGTGVSAVWNAWMVWQLSQGQHSYTEQYKKWKRVLKPRERIACAPESTP